MRKWLVGLGVALALSLAAGGAYVATQTTQCGGSFVPSLNCRISGLWNYVATDRVSGLPTPFQVAGSTATGVVSAVTDLSNAQVLALHTTPVTVVSAPGAGKYIDVIAVDLAFKYTATYSAGSNLKLFYASRNGGNAASSSVTVANFLTGVSASVATHVAGIPDNTNPPTTSVPVVIQGTANTAFTGGDAANAVRVVVWYRIVTTGL